MSVSFHNVFSFAKTLISYNMKKGSYKIVILMTTLPKQKKEKQRSIIESLQISRTELTQT